MLFFLTGDADGGNSVPDTGLGLVVVEGGSKGRVMASSALPAPAGPQMALVGDTHGNKAWTRRVIRALGAAGVDMAVQLGDFGWWPGKWFAKEVSRAAVTAGITLCFLDGNHENHEHLRFHASLRDPDRGPSDPVEMYPSLWYLPRGCAWEWHGVRFRALGGAYSIDHATRTPGHDLFPAEEVPSAADAERAIAGGPADVLLCHDYPALGYVLRGRPLADADERASRQVQTMLAEVAEAIRPKLVIHGHWHHAYAVELPDTAVVGLDCDGTDQAVALLDLDTLQTAEWSLPGLPHHG